MELQGWTCVLRFGPHAVAILSRTDGRRLLAEIRAVLTVELDQAEFRVAFDELYAQLNDVNVLLLRHAPP